MTADWGIVRAGKAAVCLALTASLIACREVEVWSGTQLQEDGHQLALAAKTPLCGCITLQNRTNQPVLVESVVHDAMTGTVIIPANDHITQRFDWAGAKADDFYILKSWTTQGSSLPFEQTVATSLSPWADCTAPRCDFAPLMMNVAVVGRSPGQR